MNYLGFILAALSLALPCVAQQQPAAITAEYPDAPTPAIYAMVIDPSSTTVDSSAAGIESSSPSVSVKKQHDPRLVWTERHSLDLALAGSLGYDMFWTYKNMTHPLIVTYSTCDDSQAWEMTMAQCLADPNHTIGTSHSGIDPAFFSEDGWTKIFGGRNVGMTIAGQTMEDALLAYLNHRLSKKGHMSRMIGRGLMSYKIAGHLAGGYSNVRGISSVEHMFVPDGAWNVQWQ